MFAEIRRRQLTVKDNFVAAKSWLNGTWKAGDNFQNMLLRDPNLSTTEDLESCMMNPEVWRQMCESRDFGLERNSRRKK